MTLPKLKKIYLASPRGFCAGVERSIKMVNLVLKIHSPPIYVRHQIVHNQHIVSDFKKKGVIFVESLNQIPNNSVVIFSAHGSPPNTYIQAKKKKLIIYDAACPLVIKVHFEIKRYVKEGCFILYIGHKYHAETQAVLAEVPIDSAMLIESLDQTKKVKPPQTDKLVILTQTTISLDETKEMITILKKRFPKLILPPSSDICFSTQNRQNAVKALAEKVDLILVVGSRESSNSNRLKDVALKAGVRAYLINDKSEIKNQWLKNVATVGITAGASAPEYLVKELIDYLSNKNHTMVEQIETVKENTHFSLPKNLKLINH